VRDASRVRAIDACSSRAEEVQASIVAASLRSASFEEERDRISVWIFSSARWEKGRPGRGAHF
jgi:hypothetical protein